MTRVVFSVAAMLVLAVAARADDKPAPDKAKPESKPIIIQIDGSKLPPEVLKRLIELSGPVKTPPAKTEEKPAEEKKGPPKVPPGLARKPDAEGKPQPKPEGKPQPKPEAKSINLTQAIAIAEKTAGGTAIRAERKGEGADLHYKVDVVAKDGQRQKVELDAAGKVRAGEEDKKPEGKPSGPKKDD